MTTRLNGQILFVLALIIANTVYASQIAQMSRPFANGEPGAAFMPMILCAFVYCAGVSLIITELRKPADTTTADAFPSHVPQIALIGPLVMIGLTVLFIIGFFYVGYVVSSAIYIFLTALYFNFEETGDLRRALLIGIVTSFVVTLFGWLFFVKLFDLYLPLWEF